MERVRAGSVPAVRNGGNYMWVALNKSDALARIDIRTKQVKEYNLPQGSAPYAATVDKNGMVWVPPQNADRIFKFDPKNRAVHGVPAADPRDRPPPLRWTTRRLQ